jgi:hypothetical protein
MLKLIFKQLSPGIPTKDGIRRDGPRIPPINGGKRHFSAHQRNDP